jgi:hypothetical protein
VLRYFLLQAREPVPKADRNDHLLIVDAQAQPLARAAAIKRLGSDNRFDVEPAIRALLSRDTPPLVRSSALSVLLSYWCRSDLVGFALSIIQCSTDSDEESISELADERIDVAGILATYATTCASDSREIVAALLAKLETSDNSEVLRACYVSLLTILSAPEDEKWLPHPFDVETCVDWARIQAYLREPDRLGRNRTLGGHIREPTRRKN